MCGHWRRGKAWRRGQRTIVLRVSWHRLLGGRGVVDGRRPRLALAREDLGMKEDRQKDDAVSYYFLGAWEQGQMKKLKKPIWGRKKRVSAFLRQGVLGVAFNGRALTKDVVDIDNTTRRDGKLSLNIFKNNFRRLLSAFDGLRWFALYSVFS